MSTELPPPPPIRNHEGADILNDVSVHLFPELDYGAFWAVWELLEARNNKQWLPAPARRAFQSAVDAFRTAYYTKYPERLPRVQPKVVRYLPPE